MPYKVANYKNGKIYKIEHLEKPELIYIGSTTQFNRRKANHKRACNNETGSAYNFKLYDMVRLNGGWNEFKMMVIKEYPCNNKTELLIEEEKHRKEYQASLNKIRAYRTEEETKQYNKEYTTDNIKKITEYQNKWRNDNKDYPIKWKNENKDYFKDYREAQKLKQLIIQKEEPIILTGSPTETETEDEEADEPQIIEVLGNGVKVEIQIY